MKTTIIFGQVVLLVVFSSITACFAQTAKEYFEKNNFYELYAPTKEELRTAKKEVDFAVVKFEKYLGEKPPKIAIVIKNSPEETAKIDFRSFYSRGLPIFPYLSNLYFKSIEKPNTNHFAEAKALSHEAGHWFFITYARKKIKDPRKITAKSNYGHAGIPDWFDEAVAMLCEVPQLQSRRFEYLNKNLDKTIPLEEFFTMEHPLSKRLTKIRNLKKGKINAVSGNQIVNEKDKMFYSQALTLARFLAEKKGDLIIEKIAHGLMADKNIKKIFAEMNDKNLNFANLEKDWKKWVKESEFK